MEANPASLFEIADCNLLKDGSENERPAEDLIPVHPCLSSIELGILCSMESPKERPSMKEVTEDQMDYL